MMYRTVFSRWLCLQVFDDVFFLREIKKLQAFRKYGMWKKRVLRNKNGKSISEAEKLQ